MTPIKNAAKLWTAAVLLAAGTPQFAARAGDRPDGPDEIEPREIDEPEIEEREIERPEIEQPEVEPAEVEVREVEPPEIERPEIERPEIEPVEVEVREVERPEVEEHASREIEAVEIGDEIDDRTDQSGKSDDAADNSGSGSSGNDSGDSSGSGGRDGDGGDSGGNDSTGGDSTGGDVERLDASGLLENLARDERPDRDDAGFPVRREEIAAMDISPAAVASLEAQGFEVIARRHLTSLEHDVVRLSTPPGMALQVARERVVAADPAATVDLVHYYGLGLTAGGRPHKVRSSDTVRPAAAGGQAWRVGLIDTDVAPHPALAQTRLVPWSEGRKAGGPTGHGTAVASILARGGQPTIYSANIFRGPANRPYTSAEVLADALEWMTEQGAPVVNLSLAGPRNAVVDRLIAQMTARGISIVAAAGNGGPAAAPAYPGALPGVIAVTAVDKDMRIYRYANHGAYIAVATSGVDVVAANAKGGMARYSGTSFATPRVAAMMGRCRADGAKAQACRDRLEHAARDLGPVGRDDTYGFGFVD